MDKADGPVIEIVKRSDGVEGLRRPARRWVVERTLRMVRALPVSGKGLGSLHRILRSVAPHRFHTPNGEVHRKSLKIIEISFELEL